MTEISGTKLRRLLKKYCNSLKLELNNIWDSQKMDISNVRRTEVLGGLASRQYRLVSVYAENPGLWSFDIGMIFIRCMAETHITLAWLSAYGSLEDYDNFVEYGLGQQKLILEHVKKHQSQRFSDDMTFKEYIDRKEAEISVTIRPEFLSVNLGSWIKKSARLMAEETHCLDLYNTAYLMGSAYVHGSWNSLQKSNLRYCRNPLHKLHKILNSEYTENALDTLHWAMQITEETLNLWANSVNAHPVVSSAYSMYWKQLDSIVEVTR